MYFVTRSVPGRRLASSFSILAALFLPATTAAPGDELSSSQQRATLTDRERNFLKLVLSGDEDKAAQYAGMAGIHPDAMAGASLSSWFYERGPVADEAVQRIVFGRFRQNPNAPRVGDRESLARFCDMPQLPFNAYTAVLGSPAEKAAMKARLEGARRSHVDKMMSGFRSLLRYGLRDRSILTGIFVGCFSNRMVPKTPEYYDLVYAPMIKAGADINGDRSLHPLLEAVRDNQADMVERLIEDGADVSYRPPSPDGTPYGRGPCQPRADQSLYRFIFDNIRQNDPGSTLRIVKALARKGVSPDTKWGFGSGNQCKYVTLYGSLVDAGNMAVATQLKELGTSGSPQRLASAENDTASPAAAPLHFGAWEVLTERGIPVATTKARDPDAANLSGIRLECVSGHLEYVPVTRQRTPATLWVSGMDDIHYTIPLGNGRVRGADNVDLSKEFLGSEANFRRNGTTDWDIEMSTDGEDAGMQPIRMSGFSEMRRYMLANCRKR